MHKTVIRVTEKIIERSRKSRQAYLDENNARLADIASRDKLSAANKAHAFAACPAADKQRLLGGNWPNIAIVSAYNDMLSAHQPYEGYPDLIRKVAREHQATAQMAGGVPAMCDGVTQGQQGMELSLFSRDVIAMSTAVALSHGTFDTALYLGICDKIVPGLLIGAIQFGYLPAIFVPAGPMTSGLPNSKKAQIRQLYAEKKVSREELLEAECESYHGPGTCTFYGTANSNQMLMEFMGLHLPGAAFVNANTPLRDALTSAATKRAIAISNLGDDFTPLSEVISEKSIVNGIVGLLSTGGSTNHTLHIPAIARAAGIHITWDDFADLSEVVPLLTRIYPNGQADVNHFHAAGGVGYLMRQLLDAGLVHTDVRTVVGHGLEAYCDEPSLVEGQADWGPAPTTSGDTEVLTTMDAPFDQEGGMRCVDGDLGRAIVKVSAVAADKRKITAPVKIFHDQDDVVAAFERGELEGDYVIVLRFQGPAAKGMPELHKLSASLGALQDRGHKIALVTDGRMSGASGKILAAIHVTPEASHGGNIARLQDGDIVCLDANTGELSVNLTTDDLAKRDLAVVAVSGQRIGFGRDLFTHLRKNCSSAEDGASILFVEGDAI